MNSITFYSNPLSSVNPSDLSPVLLSVNSSSSIETFISPLIPQLPLNSNSLFSRSLLSSLSSRQSPNLIQSLFCACGGLSSQDLQCKHKICSTCALQGFCNFCNSKLPSYSHSSRHPCLSCSVTRVQRLDCPHYCLTCLKRKLRSTEKFSCLICCLTFHKTEIETLKAVCSKCLTLSNTFFELSCGCLSCQDCLIQALKQKKCLKCEESLEFKELLKLKKGLKFRCLLCFNLKSKKYFSRRCCSAKICRKCEDGSTRCCK